MAAKKTNNGTRDPRILIVTPEITYLPSGMGNMANRMRAKAGGLADVSASLVSALFKLGADIHVALPHYRRMFNIEVGNLINNELRTYKKVLPDSRIHLAQDRAFYYRSEVYDNYHAESQRVSIAFQREIINNIIPKVNPDLIHCNDWMTGLIPAMARRMGIPCLFTVHNIHTQEILLRDIEEGGIDAAEFWPNLYFVRVPGQYEATREENPVDLLASGIFSAHFVNSVSQTFLDEVCDGHHDSFVPYHVRGELIQKRAAGCAFGILNAPDPSFDPRSDSMIESLYSAETHPAGKRANKKALQRLLGLTIDPSAPLFFWPSRLDPVQKGCQLLAEILYDVISKYWDRRLQVVIVANGPYQQHFRDILHYHDFYNRMSVCDFDEKLSHLAYAASDFMLMPSLFEPCGLPQMISASYGSLPIVHDTGGLHDTISHLDCEKRSGNGFVFKVYDSQGFFWAIDQAMDFFECSDDIKSDQISRVMTQSLETFNHSTTAASYCDVYEKMLKRPLVTAF